MSQRRPVCPRMRTAVWLLSLVCLSGGHAVHAAPPGVGQGVLPPPAGAAVPGEAVPLNSALDAPTFYEILLAELQAQGAQMSQSGQTGQAFELFLDAAQRTQDEGLYRRAIEVAIQERSSERAVRAAQMWRTQYPDSLQANSTWVQLLIVTNQPDKIPAALSQVLKQLPEAKRVGTIGELARHLGALPNKARALKIAEQVLAPYLGGPPTRTAARVCLGQLALMAEQPDAALAHMRRAHSDDPRHASPVLLALELANSGALDALPVVEKYVQADDTPVNVRIAYARYLEQHHRLAPSTAQLRLAQRAQPENRPGWLALGIQLVELYESEEAIQALTTYVDRQTTPSSGGTSPSSELDDGEQALRALDVARHYLAKASFQRGNVAVAQQWLDQIPAERTEFGVLMLRAQLLVKQKQVPQAVQLIRDGRTVADLEPRARVLAEAQILRDADQWQQSYDLLLQHMRQSPEDGGLIYELAMTAEHLQRYDDAEVLLRRAMQLDPRDAQAYNALGYSLAERNERLDEAHSLVQKALDLMPEDAFIQDSMGWVLFRQGQHERARNILQQAFDARPHPEIAAHLGEVLWVMGRPEQARAIWRDGLKRDAKQDTLRQTLERLKVQW